MVLFWGVQRAEIARIACQGFPGLGFPIWETFSVPIHPVPSPELARFPAKSQLSLADKTFFQKS